MLMKEAMDVASKNNLGIPIDRIKSTLSVQLEREIWWLGTFEVPKETRKVLTFVFEQIPWINNMIKDQISG